MYELWHKPTSNAVDFYENAIVAEQFLIELAKAHGASVLEEYVLMFEGDRIDGDFTIDGPGLLEAVKRLANEERLNGQVAVAHAG
jgi:hypothetical protein